MLHRIWRQRRRLVLGLVGAALGTALGGSLAMFLGLAALFGALVVWLPAQRAWVERLALLWPLVCAAGLAPLLLPSVLVLGGVVLGVVAGALDFWRLNRALGTEASALIDCPETLLWDGLFPRAFMTPLDPLVTRIETTPDGRLRLGYLGGGEQLVEVMEHAPGAFWQTRTVPEGPGQHLAVTAQMLAAEPGGTRLTILEAHWGLPALRALALWLDDYLADHLDRIKALAEGRPDPSLKGALAAR